MNFPISLDTFITALTFILAIAYQSITLKISVKTLLDRVSKLEQCVEEITRLLIAQESTKVKLDNLDLRLQHIEERCFAFLPKPSECEK